MRGRFRLLKRAGVVGVTVALMVLSPTSASAATDVTDPAQRVESLEGVSLSMTLSLDPTAGTVGIESIQGIKATLDQSGNVVSSQPLPNDAFQGSVEAAAGSNYQCLVQTQQGKALKGYTPVHVQGSGLGWELHYILFPYSVDNARYISGYYTWQAEMCVTGGGHTWNGYKQVFDAASVTNLYQSTPRKIGQNWGTNSTIKASSVTSKLNFSLNTGLITIGAETTVTVQDTYAGSQNHDDNYVLYPSSWSNYNANRVNMYWKSPDNFAWDGTEDFEGNNGHALYEYPMSYVSGKTIYFGVAAEQHRFCGRWWIPSAHACEL